MSSLSNYMFYFRLLLVRRLTNKPPIVACKASFLLPLEPLPPCDPLALLLNAAMAAAPAAAVAILVPFFDHDVFSFLILQASAAPATTAALAAACSIAALSASRFCTLFEDPDVLSSFRRLLLPCPRRRCRSSSLAE